MELYNKSNIDFFETVIMCSLRKMQVLQPDFLVRKFFGRIARKSAETVHLRKIFFPYRERNQVEKPAAV